MLKKRTEILNFKNEQNFQTFVEITNNSDELKKCFIDENEDLENASKAWLKCIKLILKASFTKIRLKKSSLKPQLQLLFKERESLKTKIALLENKNEYHDIHIQQNNLDDVNRKISDLCAERNKIIVNEYLGKTDDTIEGYNQARTWSMKKKLFPKNTVDPPCAKKDSNGHLVTSKDALENLYVETYKERLKPNNVKPGGTELKALKEYLFKINFETAKENHSEDWNLKDLEKALKSFKNNKARYELRHTHTSSSNMVELT